MKQEVVEDPKSELALADAFDVLERHVSEDNGQLARLAVLLGKLDQKVMRLSARVGSGAESKPESKQIIVCFVPKAGSELQVLLDKAPRKSLPFDVKYADFFDAMIDEVKALVAHDWV